ncbi:MAG: glycine cleavage T C-terminal barrel domain-containing protein, partial [Pseudomonadota bacterium]
VSIADSDLILFYKGVAAALGLDVKVHEPQVSPLAIQGPKADELARRIWGDQVLDIKFFRQKRVDVNGKSMILARSGYSVQGGYELYFEGETGADTLWDQLMEAGRDLDVRSGAPSQSERVEAGLLSYLSDITQDMTPFEAGLGKMCSMDSDIGCLAYDALKKNQEPVRQVRPVEIDGDPLPPQGTFWRVSDHDGNEVGRISSSCRAYSYACNAAIGLIDRSHWETGTELVVHVPDGERKARVVEKFWGR